MNPRASRCSRTLRRQIIPSKDALCITDSLLAQAFESSCRVSLAWNRRASHVPGPLESQRRLGRRRMGDLNALQYPPTPPPWEFPFPLDLSKWKWQPPGLTATVTEPEPQPDEAKAEYDEPKGWLFKAMGTVFIHQMARQKLLSSAASISQARASIQAELDELRGLEFETPASTKIGHAKATLNHVRMLLALNKIPSEEVLPIMTEVWDTFELEFSSSPHLSGILGMAIWDIMEGISISKTCAPCLLDAEHWRTVLRRMLKLPADSYLGDLLVHVASIIPEAEHGRVLDDILSIYKSFFKAWLSSQGRVGVDLMTWSLDASFGTNTRATIPLSISEALGKIVQGERTRLLDAAEKIVVDLLSQEGASETHHVAGRCELRYKWLSVVAHSPWARQAFLFSKVLRLSDTSFRLPPLTGSELSSLMLAQWESRGYLHSLKRIVRHCKKNYKRRQDDANAITSMLYAFDRGTSPQPPIPIFVSFWRFMAILDRTNDILASLEAFTDTAHLPARFLATLAFSARNHYAALAIRELYTFKVRRGGEQEFDPGVFYRYITDILSDPALPLDTLPRAIGTDFLLPFKPESARPPTPPDRFWPKKATVLERTAIALVTLDLPHLTDRQIWRRVEHCVNFFSYTRGQVPMKLIEIVYQLATRDLHQGRPGRTERLAWLQFLIYRSCGPQVAEACRRLIVAWRRQLLKVNPDAKVFKPDEIKEDIEEVEVKLKPLDSEYEKVELNPKVELDNLGGDTEINFLNLRSLAEDVERRTKELAAEFYSIEQHARKKKNWVYEDENPEWEGPNIPELFRLKRVEKKEDSNYD
ncbi:hypothetical protein QBC38DRAFT_28495 [Podospora fimiseda]|uniref:Uncharacterized protein n=1 Tax=Podospora fimiseda TaxID=252190 RepID=A0AAN7BVT3_9PEZI|nr:hypothetical protein QBC38DRAFT_28495 [Podospora fimiseda]